LNNIGYQVPKKVDFIKDYKFTIAFENSVCEGYTTEKIFEPMLCNSIPIYYGNPLVDKDFNPSSFIWMKNPDSIKETIEEIIRLDLDDDAYIGKLSQPYFASEQLCYNWEKELDIFLNNIFNRSSSQLKRAATYGFNMFQTNELAQMVLLRNRQKKINRWKSLMYDISATFKIRKSI
jgi:hypothetical protein